MPFTSGSLFFLVALLVSSGARKKPGFHAIRLSTIELVTQISMVALFKTGAEAFCLVAAVLHLDAWKKKDPGFEFQQRGMHFLGSF